MSSTAGTTQTTTYETGSLHHVVPLELLLQRNIREATPTDELVESIRDVGVLQPITAVVTTDGQLLVRHGHRRALAAVEAARDTVPVYVAGSDDQADAAEISRIVGQHAENTHRAGLTAGDDVAVFEQLAAFGLPAVQIATRTRAKVDRVETALRVSRSELARKAASRYEALTLDQAATVAEFEHDTKVAKALVVAAVEDPTRFAHVAQEARDEQARENRRQKLLEEAARHGAVVVDPPDYSDKCTELLYLRTTAEAKDTLSLAKHKKCPGHVAWLREGWEEFVDEAGEPVARTRVDRNVHRHVMTWGLYYGCADPTKHGHHNALRGTSAAPTVDDLSEEEREKAKKARRLVIDNNKAWESATVVRREFLADLAQGKKAPAGAAAFISAAIGLDRMVLINGDSSHATKLCADWGLPTEKRGSSDVVVIPDKTTEARALVITLVQALAAHEAATTRDAWRANGKDSREGRYLRFLQSCGYGLSDVEKFALNTKTA